MSEVPDPQRLAAWTERARAIAAAGGEAIRAAAGSVDRDRVGTKSARRDLVTAADRASERAVVGALLAEFPEHAVLAEEGELTPTGATSRDSDLVWVVDPLDGTTNFVHGLQFYCVALGLLYRGEPVLGVVHAPALGVTYHAYRGGGAFRDEQPIKVSRTAEIPDALLATGFSYRRDEPGRDDNTARVVRALHACRDLRRYGSAELDLCMLAAGHFDGYWEVHLEAWDVAAGAAIVRAAGGAVTDLRGGNDWLYGGSVLASNGHLHEALLGVVGDRHGRA